MIFLISLFFSQINLVLFGQIQNDRAENKVEPFNEPLMNTVTVDSEAHVKRKSPG